MEEGKMIHADTGVGNGCVEENVNRLSGEYNCFSSLPRYCNFRSNVDLAAHINPKESSPASNPQRSCSSPGISPPLGWLQ